MDDAVRAAKQRKRERLRTDCRHGLFYHDGVVQVWHGDARALPLPDASVNLVITSPPYNCRVPYDGYDDWLPWNQ